MVELESVPGTLGHETGIQPRLDDSQSQGTMNTHIHTLILTRGKLFCIRLTSEVGSWNYVIFDLCAFELQIGGKKPPQIPDKLMYIYLQS